MSGEQGSRPLTFKQRRFVEAYLCTWNGSEAARQAGYRGEANRLGSRLLSIVEVREAIEKRLKECAMQSDEVLKRLADQARVNIADFVREKLIPELDKDGSVVFEIQGIELNWNVIKERGHLIKSISSTQYGPKIEVYDGQAALVQIGKHAGLFKEAVQGKVDVVNYTLDQWKAASAERERQAQETAELFEGVDECSGQNAPGS